MKVSKDKDGIVTREVLTKHGPTGSTTGRWTSTSRAGRRSSKWRRTGLEWRTSFCPARRNGSNSTGLRGTLDRRLYLRKRMAELPHSPKPGAGIEDTSHTYATPGRYIIAVKVIDIFGNDTMTLHAGECRVKVMGGGRMFANASNTYLQLFVGGRRVPLR